MAVVEHREVQSLQWPAHRRAGLGTRGPPSEEEGGLAVTQAEGPPPPASAGSEMRYCAGDAP